MIAGPELDREIHTLLGHVDQFGWAQRRFCDLEWQGGYQYICRRCGHPMASSTPAPRVGPCVPDVPPYSSDIAAAWAMLDRFWAVEVTRCNGTTPEVIVTIGARDGRQWDASGSAFPDVACRAALLATLDAGEARRQGARAGEEAGE